MFANFHLPSAGTLFMARTGAPSPTTPRQGSGRPWQTSRNPGRPHHHQLAPAEDVHCGWCWWGGSYLDLGGRWACPRCGGRAWLYGGPRPRWRGLAVVGRAALYLALTVALLSLLWTVSAALGWAPLFH